MVGLESRPYWYNIWVAKNGRRSHLGFRKKRGFPRTHLCTGDEARPAIRFNINVI